MTNEEIIYKAAILAGLYNEEEISYMVEKGIDIPIHTISGWKLRGNYKIKPGERGIETRLWKQKKQKGKGEADGNNHNGFYLTKAYLFTKEQVELEEDKNV